MNYTILTESEFFNILHSQQQSDIKAAYNQFIRQIIDLCQNRTSQGQAIITLTYAEIELQYMPPQDTNVGKDLYVRKALMFVRLMLKHILSHIAFGPVEIQTPFKWTGSLVEFVELMYGLQEMKSVDNGNIAINELCALFGKLLNVDVKDNQYYSAYFDIKQRKSRGISRTYFIDKMSERLNLRMQRDDERELRRR